MDNRDEYVEKLKAQLDQWNSQMAAWEAASRKATAEAKTELEKQMGIMKSRADDLVFRMGLMKGASADAWQEIARAADEARKTMQDAFEKARVRFKDLYAQQADDPGLRAHQLDQAHQGERHRHVLDEVALRRDGAAHLHVAAIGIADFLSRPQHGDAEPPLWREKPLTGVNKSRSKTATKAYSCQ